METKVDLKPEDSSDTNLVVKINMCPSDPAEANMCDSCQ